MQRNILNIVCNSSLSPLQVPLDFRRSNSACEKFRILFRTIVWIHSMQTGHEVFQMHDNGANRIDLEHLNPVCGYGRPHTNFHVQYQYHSRFYHPNARFCCLSEIFLSF